MPDVPLADRIRARMAEQPEIVAMSDEQVDRIACVLAPIPPAKDARAGAPSAVG